MYRSTSFAVVTIYGLACTLLAYSDLCTRISIVVHGAPQAQVSSGYGGIRVQDLNRRMTDAWARGDTAEFNRLRAQADRAQQQNYNVASAAREQQARNERIERENRRRISAQRNAYYSRSIAESNQRLQDRKNSAKIVKTVLWVIGLLSLSVFICCGIAGACANDDDNNSTRAPAENADPSIQLTVLPNQQLQLPETGGFLEVSPEQSTSLRNGLPTDGQSISAPPPASPPQRSPLIIMRNGHIPVITRQESNNDPTTPPPTYEQVVQSFPSPSSAVVEYAIQPPNNPDLQDDSDQRNTIRASHLPTRK